MIATNEYSYNPTIQDRIFEIAGSIKLDVNLENEIVWLFLEQMSKLFGRDKPFISRHIKHVFEEGELERNSTIANFATVQTEESREVERNIDYYNLMQ